MRFRPGHWALSGRKIGTDAVPLLRLGLPNQRPQAAFRRRGGPMWPPAVSSPHNLSPTTPKGALSTDRRNPKRLPETQRQR